MTEDYKPTDNAIAERVNGIIKQEWLYRMQRPKDLHDANGTIGRIVDFYNNRRPHMSNGMKTPAQMREDYFKKEDSSEASRLRPSGRPPWCFS
jgi:transposase InsO family protein